MEPLDLVSHFERYHNYTKLGDESKAAFTPAVATPANNYTERFGLRLYEDTDGYLLTCDKHVEINFQHEKEFFMRFGGVPPEVVGTNIIDDLWPTNPRTVVLDRAVDFRNPTPKPAADGFKAAHFPFTEAIAYVAHF